MDLKQLEYFRHVAELGSFTRAASFLSVVQPALSRQVRQLEVELGQNLFERNGRGVVLTDAGTRLLEHTRGILMQVGRARQELEDQRNGDSGHFALGLPPSLGRSLTVPLVKAFAQLLPHAKLATVEGLSVYILEWLNVGRVDCALVYDAPASPAVDLQPLLDEQLFLIAPRPLKASRRARKSITVAELADHRLIIPSRPHAMRMSVENALAAVDRKITVAHEIESIPAVIDLVRQGHGFAVLPLNAVRSTQWADAVEAKPILSPVLKTSLCVVTSAQRPKSSLVRKAIDVIRDIVRREIRSAEDPHMSKPHDYDSIPGTYVYDAARSRIGYNLNMFCMSLNKIENRKSFKDNESAYLDRFALDPEQRRTVLERDWLGMLRVGGNIYYTIKIAFCDGLTFQDVAGMMCGVPKDEYAKMMLAGGRSPDGNRHKQGSEPTEAARG